MRYSTWFRSAALAAAVLACFRIGAGNAADPTASSNDVLRAEAGEIAACWLENAFAGQPLPEATEMLVAIARGSRLGPGEGWFHPGQCRYDWKWLAARHGIAPESTIPREAFRGPRSLFDRLDRNQDGLLSAADFSGFASARATDNATGERSRRTDVLPEARLTREEWNRLFDQLACGKDYLTRSDFQAALAKASSATSPVVMPSPQVLVRGLFRGEIGSMREGPALDSPAPDFTLQRLDGKERLHLSEHFGKKPIVLTFGNYTCGPFRATYAGVDELAQRYRNDALFLAVYVREAHPTDGWRMKSNDSAGVVVSQPRTYAERIAVAEKCNARLKMNMPLFVDEIDDRVGHAYSGMPGRLYLIDSDGKVAYKSGRGPFGFKPSELEQALALLLVDRASRSK